MVGEVGLGWWVGGGGGAARRGAHCSEQQRKGGEEGGVGGAARGEPQADAERVRGKRQPRALLEQRQTVARAACPGEGRDRLVRARHAQAIEGERVDAPADGGHDARLQHRRQELLHERGGDREEGQQPQEHRCEAIDDAARREHGGGDGVRRHGGTHDDGHAHQKGDDLIAHRRDQHAHAREIRHDELHQRIADQ